MSGKQVLISRLLWENRRALKESPEKKGILKYTRFDQDNEWREEPHLKNLLLIDFGSTYTKITAVDLERSLILGTARAVTTIREGIEVGLRKAEAALAGQTGTIRYDSKLACSSAAGGLRMVAVGLVPELTVEAARMAALGAGARVIGAYGFMLSDGQVAEIVRLSPDLLILSGGTDGGDRETVLHNGALLSASSLTCPIILAGNQTVQPELAERLAAYGKTVYRLPNVLPEPGELNIEPVQAEIRSIFLERIIHAKGLDKVLPSIDGIMMPTPAAALNAARRLADGDGFEQGLGELMLVDVGGATTDVHTVAAGFPTDYQVNLRGLPEPVVKRTVEGDMGMRYSAAAVVEAVGLANVARLSGLPDETILAGLERRIRDVGMIPETAEDAQFEAALGFLAVRGAVDRHAGRLETVNSSFGITYIQTGKDLTRLPYVIGTGGILANHPEPARLLQGACFDRETPNALMPKIPRFLVDRRYVLPTLGLIADLHPEVAYRLMRESLVEE